MSSAPGAEELLGKILALVDVELPLGDGQDSTPRYMIMFLRESQDFWDDEERDLIDSVWAEYLGHSDDLAANLAAVWGRPTRVPLGPVLDRSNAGEIIPPLPDELSQFAVHVDVWRVGNRVVCLGVGQHDKELPVVLFAAVGDHWFDDASS